MNSANLVAKVADPAVTSIRLVLKKSSPLRSQHPESAPNSIPVSEIPESVPVSEIPESIPVSEISEIFSMKEIPESVPETESPEPALEKAFPEPVPESALDHNHIAPPKKVLEGAPPWLELPAPVSPVSPWRLPSLPAPTWTPACYLPSLQGARPSSPVGLFLAWGEKTIF